MPFLNDLKNITKEELQQLEEGIWNAYGNIGVELTEEESLYSRFSTYKQFHYQTYFENNLMSSLGEPDNIALAHIGFAFHTLYPNSPITSLLPTENGENLLPFGLLKIDSENKIVFKYKPLSDYFVTNFIVHLLTSNLYHLKVKEFVIEEFYKKCNTNMMQFLKHAACKYAVIEEFFVELANKRIVDMDKKCDLHIISPRKLSDFLLLDNCSLYNFFKDDIENVVQFFISFYNESNLEDMKTALEKSFIVAPNIGFAPIFEKLQDCFAPAFNNYIFKCLIQKKCNMAEIQSMLVIFLGISNETDDKFFSDSEKLENFLLSESCNELKFSMLCVFLKYFQPKLINLKELTNEKFKRITRRNPINITNTQNYIESKYPTDSSVVDLLKVERNGVSLVKGTAILTTEMVEIFDNCLKNSTGGWAEIYGYKISTELIIPLINMKMEGLQCDVDDDTILRMLVKYSKHGLERVVEYNALKNTLKFLEIMANRNTDYNQQLAQFLFSLGKTNFNIFDLDYKLILVERKSGFTYHVMTNVNALKQEINKLNQIHLNFFFFTTNM